MAWIDCQTGRKIANSNSVLGIGRRLLRKWFDVTKILWPMHREIAACATFVGILARNIHISFCIAGYGCVNLKGLDNYIYGKQFIT